jgi:hypothetical protein
MDLKATILSAGALVIALHATAQNKINQQGIVLKEGTNIRLGNISILNKRSRDRSLSSVWGVFSIPVLRGDTLECSGNNFQSTDFVVSDDADRIIYLAPVLQLNEVTVKEYSLKSDIKEVQRGYREKSVFYTGTPHYYYLVLKPMTFIYENFKSEVIEARRFNRFARRELEASAVSARFNNSTIKAAIPIKDSEIEHFKLAYFPTMAQVNGWNDYDLINYIKAAFSNFEKEGENTINLDLKLSCCE